MNPELSNPGPELPSYVPGLFGPEVVTVHGIARWIQRAREDGATHMIVVCDTFDYDDYPVNVMPDEDVHERVEYFRNASMQKVMEVYWLEGDLDDHLAKRRSWTFGPEGATS